MPTTSPLIVSNARPVREFDNITQIGLKVLNLAVLYQGALEGRFPAEIVTGLQQDLEALGVVVPAATHARIDAQSATEAQHQTVKKAVLLVSGIRKAVWSAGPSKEVQHAYGVGRRISKSVAAGKVAIKQILDRLDKHPEEAPMFGILPADIEALTAARDQVSAASVTQNKKRASAPQTTKTRNATANRILHAAKRIAGAGVLAFASSPVVRAEFAAIKFGATKKAPKNGDKPPKAPKAPKAPKPPVAPAPADQASAPVPTVPPAPSSQQAAAPIVTPPAPPAPPPPAPPQGSSPVAPPFI